MSFWTAIVVIVAIGAITSVLRSRYNAQSGTAEGEMGAESIKKLSERGTEEAQAEIAQLKERIAILERIATDNNSTDARERERIASEIEALREADTTKN